MSAARLVATALLAAVLAAGCGGGTHSVLVPPRLDLQPYGRVGLFTFTAEGAKGSLNEVATEHFSEAMLNGQSGIEVLELGTEDTLLQRVGETEFGTAAAQAVGKERHLPAVFVGHLTVSNIKPSGGLLGLSAAFVQATVSVELSVRLLSTESGGTLWRSSAAASEKVGGLSMVNGEPHFAAKNPNDAYGQLVDRLVYAVTRDLRPTWERVRNR
jgi:hypothetical protein